MFSAFKKNIKILLVIFVITNLTACKNKKVSEENMVKVILDGFLANAYLQQYNTESQLIQHHTYMRDSIYINILKHYNIDTTQFYKTLSYYEANPSAYQKILNIVQDSIYKIDSVLLANGKTQQLDSIVKIDIPITNDSILQQKSQEYLEKFKQNKKQLKRPKN